MEAVSPTFRRAGWGGFLLILTLLGQVACATGDATSRSPKDEWQSLSTDYRWIQTLRSSQPRPEPGATRKEQIEILLENHRKIESVWIPFMDRLKEYADRTGDVRAAKLWAEEMAALGDEYLDVLSRPDRALAIYRSALQTDPSNNSIRDRIARAERMRFIDADAFGQVRVGMTQSQVVSLIGRPREDWIRQIVRDGKTFSVWIYPRRNGGAAAVYIDERGVVYHTNWDAAPGDDDRDGGNM